MPLQTSVVAAQADIVKCVEELQDHASALQTRIDNLEVRANTQGALIGLSEFLIPVVKPIRSQFTSHLPKLDTAVVTNA
jgi:hypothetical protein